MRSNFAVDFSCSLRNLFFEKENRNHNNKPKGLINIFLSAVYLYDDKFMLVLNGGNVPITISDMLLDEIEADNAEFECSRMVASAPPA